MKQSGAIVSHSVAVDAGHSSSGDSTATDQPRLRVLHVLAVSVPHLNGYTMRSKYIVQTQQSEGSVEPVVVTSPFYAGNPASMHDEVIDGTWYYRVPHPVDMVVGRLIPSDALCRFVYGLRRSLRKRAVQLRRMLRIVFIRGPRRVLRIVFIRGPRRVLHGVRLFLIVTVLGRWPKRSRRRVRRMIRTVLAQWPRSVRHCVVAVVFGLAGGLSLAAWPFRWLSRRLSGPDEHAADRGRILFRLAVFARRVIVVPALAIARRLRLSFSVSQFTAWVSGALEGWEELLLLRRFERELVRLARLVKPDVIHAHSPYRCGLPAIRAARTVGIPVVYEVRGLWEESSVASGRFTPTSTRYRFWRHHETQTMLAADAVVCICEQLRHELVGRGVEPQRIFVAPNAVDVEAFRPGSPTGDGQPPLRARLEQLRGRLATHTLGYVGSIRKLEGVDELVRGTAEVVRRGYDVSLLVVGDGPLRQDLQNLAQDLGLAERAIFTGQVPHDEIRHYYDLIDVFVISRPALRVTNLVTPLKPLEAMAMGKPLIVSDLAALRELVGDGRTGLTYEPGDVHDLADKCIRLIEVETLRQSLARAALEWVRRHRTWDVSLSNLQPAYQTALGVRTEQVRGTSFSGTAS